MEGMMVFGGPHGVEDPAGSRGVDYMAQCIEGCMIGSETANGVCLSLVAKARHNHVFIQYVG